MPKIYCADVGCMYNNDKGVCTAKKIALSWHSIMTMWEGRQEFNRCKTRQTSKEQRELEKKIEEQRTANGSEAGININNNILSVLCGQNSALTSAFNPEILAFRNKVIELQKNCPMIEWQQDMGATVPCCKLDNTLCNGQCYFRTNDCPCDTEGR